MSAAEMSSSGCSVGCGLTDLDDLDAERRPRVDDEPSRLSLQIAAQQQGTTRCRGQRPARHQPLGVDRLTQPDDAQPRVHGGHPTSYAVAHHHDGRGHSRHERRLLQVVHRAVTDEDLRHLGPAVDQLVRRRAVLRHHHVQRASDVAEIVEPGHAVDPPGTREPGHVAQLRGVDLDLVTEAEQVVGERQHVGLGSGDGVEVLGREEDAHAQRLVRAPVAPSGRRPSCGPDPVAVLETVSEATYVAVYGASSGNR